MSISSLPGPLGVNPVVPAPEQLVRGEAGVVGQIPEVRRVEPVKTAAEAPDAGSREQTPTDLQQLRTLAERAQLEVRLETLPDSDATLIRIVDPVTHEVIREFPPEGVARALSELRERAQQRLDRTV